MMLVKGTVQVPFPDDDRLLEAFSELLQSFLPSSSTSAVTVPLFNSHFLSFSSHLSFSIIGVGLILLSLICPLFLDIVLSLQFSAAHSIHL